MSKRGSDEALESSLRVRCAQHSSSICFFLGSVRVRQRPPQALAHPRLAVLGIREPAAALTTLARIVSVVVVPLSPPPLFRILLVIDDPPSVEHRLSELEEALAADGGDDPASVLGRFASGAADPASSMLAQVRPHHKRHVAATAAVVPLLCVPWRCSSLYIYREEFHRFLYASVAPPRVPLHAPMSECSCRARSSILLAHATTCCVEPKPIACCSFAPRVS